MGAATSLTGTKKVTLFHLNIQIMKDLKLSPAFFFCGILHLYIVHDGSFHVYSLYHQQFLLAG